MNMKSILGSAVIGVVASASAFMAMADSETMDHSNMEMVMEEAVHANAVVNSLGEGTMNVNHEPIPELSWPAMTMDFSVAEDAEGIDGLEKGDEIILMLIKGEDGMYMIQAVMPQS